MNEKEKVHIKRPFTNLKLKPKALERVLIRNCIKQISEGDEKTQAAVNSSCGSRNVSSNHGG